jgi:hypothetical protein
VSELHNMSVPPRTVVTVRRERLDGRRYRVNLVKALTARRPRTGAEILTCSIRNDSGAYLLKLIGDRPGAGPAGRGPTAARARLRALCDAAVRELGLPVGLGFFVDETDDGGDAVVSAAAAVGILAARSGPLYLAGRFEPSLIDIEPVTLFFPATQGGAR